MASLAAQEGKTLRLNINFPIQKHDFECDSKGLFSGENINCHFPVSYLDDLFCPDMMSQQAVINAWR